MRFLLIKPHIDYDVINSIFAFEKNTPPLGILYLAKVLENHGHKVKVIDFCAERFTKNRLQKALFSTDAVGMSVLSHEIKSVAMISDFIKEINHELPIIVGGPHCTLQPVKALYDTHADICVEGDGEKVITKIADALDGKRRLSDIPGIYYKKNNIIKKGPPMEIIEDLDLIPFPARHLVDRYRYGFLTKDITLLRGKALTSILTSRGCPRNCKFCCSRAITKKYRTRSVENVIEELKEIIYKYKYLEFIDDNFIVDKKRVEQIMDFLISEKQDIELSLEVRIGTIDKQLLKKMKKAGVRFLSFGIESGNQDVLDFYNKQITLDQIQKTVKLARQAGIITFGYFILGAPFETKKHLEKTINFAKKLRLDLPLFGPLAYLKGSNLWEEAVAAGKIHKDECHVTGSSARGLGLFSEQELWEWTIRAYKKYYLRTNYVADQILLSFIRKDFRLIKEGFKLFLEENNILKTKNIHDIIQV